MEFIWDKPSGGKGRRGGEWGHSRHQTSHAQCCLWVTGAGASLDSLSLCVCSRTSTVKVNTTQVSVVTQGPPEAEAGQKLAHQEHSRREQG